MNPYKFLVFSSIAILFQACGGGNNSASQLFDIQLEGNKNQFRQHQQIGIGLKNKKEKTIESISYSIDGAELTVQGNKVSIDVPKLGNKILKAVVNYEGTTAEISKKIKVLSATSPELYTYEILNEFAHDKKAFTQGLEFHNDTLYEGTGRKGKSSLRKVDFKTGKVLQQIDLDNNFFGEGITILGDKIYQLTWQGKTGFIYDLHNFKKIGNFQYGQSKEGWGLCNDGKKLFKSDGTEKIWLLNPDTLEEEGYIETVTDKSIFNKANELEYVDEKIYANVWQKESMMIINAHSGAIEGVVNFAGLKGKVSQHDDLDVLNGVAYHPTRETFFVTGKNWDKLFEIKIIKK
ncbi:MAG: glutaminyl-peptide cyclotransferase [Saonia sp.]